MLTQQIIQKLIREPTDAYHAKAGEYLSSHLLKMFRESPLQYRWKIEGRIPDNDRPAYLVGRALHTLVLEGREKFTHEFAIGGPVNPRTGQPYGHDTKAFREWADAQGRDVLSPDQAELVEQMAQGVLAHDAVRGMLIEGAAEGVVRSEYHGVQCQIRIDWLGSIAGTGGGVGILDLKSCDDLTWFEADARRFGYSHQLAFYRAVLAAGTGLKPLQIPVHLVGIEKRAPFRCGVWRMSEEVLAIAQRENEDAIDRLKRSRATGIWPSGYETARTFDWI